MNKIFQGARHKENPAPGFRDAGNNGRLGVLMGIGYCGFSRSSATNERSGLNLHFNSQNLYTSGSDYRGHGFQLRCLSE
ncbi:hypothetical protein [uncultured Rikenella sp.]|uniref:hypothetical protein n=1 Tax=uncultured Rikenella sp. TaxID=368003 RepID=UPI0025FF54A4|nr:hypothetical protein [uncultured Rikenella sp.]